MPDDNDIPEEPVTTSDEEPEELAGVFAAPTLRGEAGMPAALAIAAAFLVVICGSIVYSNVFEIPLHYPDDARVSQNASLDRMDTMGEGWESADVAPITALTFMSFGRDASSLHIVNVVVHFLNGCLVLLLGRRLLGANAPPMLPVLAGAVFVLHPIATETVHLGVNRDLLLGTAFALLALVLTLDHADRSRWPRVVLSVVFYVLAWSTAPMFWPLPFIALVVVATGDDDAASKTTSRSVFGLFAAMGLLVPLQFASNYSTDWLAASIGHWQALPSLLEGLFFPVELSRVHPAPQLPLALGAAAGLSIVVASTLVYGRWRAAGACGIWFGIVLVAPWFGASGGDYVESQAYFLVAPLSLVTTVVIARSALPLRRMLVPVAAVVVVALGFLTWTRNQVWASEISIWADAREKCPACSEPIRRLAHAHLDAAQAQSPVAPMQFDPDWVSPQEHLLAARALFEEFAETPEYDQGEDLARARVEHRLGEYAGAGSHLKQILANDPYNAEASRLAALNAYALAQQSGKDSDAKRAAELLIRGDNIGALDAEAMILLAAQLSQLRDYGRALDVLRELPESQDPRVQALARQLAPSYEQLQQLARNAQTRLTQNPNDLEGLLTQVRALTRTGRYLQASYLAQHTLRKHPDRIQPWIMLGLAESSRGNIESFLEHWLAPDSPGAIEDPYDLLVESLAQWDRWSDAETVLEWTLGADQAAVRSRLERLRESARTESEQEN